MCISFRRLLCGQASAVQCGESVRESGTGAQRQETPRPAWRGNELGKKGARSESPVLTLRCP